MHEASLVGSLLRQVADLAAIQGSGRVSEVRLEVGLLAGVEPRLLVEAFGRLRVGTIAESAELIVDPVGLTCRCRDCQLEYTAEELQFVCPRCQRRDVDVVGGDAVTLVSFTLLPAADTALI